MVQELGKIRGKTWWPKVNYLEVGLFLFRLNCWVWRTVKGGDMVKVRNMSEMLKEVVKKQKTSRELTGNIIKKQETARKKAQVKPSEQKLDEE